MADFFARVVTWVEQENHRFIGILRGLSEQGWRASTFCPGWSVADVVAHMTLGARFYAHVIPAGAAGRLEMPFGAADMESFWSYRKKVGDELVALSDEERIDAFGEAVWGLQEVFEGVQPDNLDKQAWHWLAPCPIRTFPGQRLYELILHDWDIRNQPDGDLHAPSLPVAVDCLPDRFPIFFGARGDKEYSGTICFETNEPERKWALRIQEGKSEILLSDDGYCDARVVCCGSDLVLLTTGRASLEQKERAGRLRIEGDRAKATRVLEVLSRPF